MTMKKSKLATVRLVPLVLVCFCCMAVFGFVGALSQRKSDEQILQPNKPIERILEGGESHSYQIKYLSKSYEMF